MKNIEQNIEVVVSQDDIVVTIRADRHIMEIFTNEKNIEKIPYFRKMLFEPGSAIPTTPGYASIRRFVPGMALCSLMPTIREVVNFDPFTWFHHLQTNSYANVSSLPWIYNKQVFEHEYSTFFESYRGDVPYEQTIKIIMGLDLLENKLRQINGIIYNTDIVKIIFNKVDSENLETGRNLKYYDREHIEL